jgi:hypothetical protein
MGVSHGRRGRRGASIGDTHQCTHPTCLRMKIAELNLKGLPRIGDGQHEIPYDRCYWLPASLGKAAIVPLAVVVAGVALVIGNSASKLFNLGNNAKAIVVASGEPRGAAREPRHPQPKLAKSLAGGCFGHVDRSEII